jgi:hypothetical protein
MRLEREHRCRQTASVGRIAQATQHFAMAQVYPIEIADGQCNRTRGSRRDGSEDSHGAVSR